MAVKSVLGVTTYMAPKDDTTGAFLAFLQGAKESIFVSIYGFHLPKATDILIAKHQAGVEVSVILDHTQEQGKAEQAEVQRLIAAGVPVLVGTSYEHGQILHLKATVVDRCRVMHGSWNYSLSAAFQLNDLHEVDSPDMARFYLSWHDAIRLAVILHEHVAQPAGEVVAPAAYAENDAQVDTLLQDTPVQADLEADLARAQPLGSASVAPVAPVVDGPAVIAGTGQGAPIPRPGPTVSATPPTPPTPPTPLAAPGALQRDSGAAGVVSGARRARATAANPAHVQRAKSPGRPPKGVAGRREAAHAHAVS